jgi:hypothetical protein
LDGLLSIFDGHSTLDDVGNGLFHHPEIDTDKFYKLTNLKKMTPYVMQSMMGHTETHMVQPVQSSVTWGM